MNSICSQGLPASPDPSCLHHSSTPLSSLLPLLFCPLRQGLFCSLGCPGTHYVGWSQLRETLACATTSRQALCSLISKISPKYLKGRDHLSHYLLLTRLIPAPSTSQPLSCLGSLLIPPGLQGCFWKHRRGLRGPIPGASLHHPEVICSAPGLACLLSASSSPTSKGPGCRSQLTLPGHLVRHP